MDGWMDIWMDGRMHALMDGWIDSWTHAWMDGHLDGWMNGWINSVIDGWMDGWMHVSSFISPVSAAGVFCDIFNSLFQPYFMFFDV